MMTPPRPAAALAALLLLLLAAAAAGQHAEDRPLPASPCADVFSYEGSTVDWDRWYGVVLVATDTPLTGLRLDVWLSRPALALRHNWDGNVTTLDNIRFTILNLYKRIEPGPPKSVRIVVKFDEKEEIPILRAIELNGRRICSSRSVSQSYDERQRPPSRRRPGYSQDDELPLSHSSPSNSKYNFDRTTQRSTTPYSYDARYDSSEHAYRNTVSKRPPSNVADVDYERTTSRRPAYSDDKYAYEAEAEDDYRPQPPARHDAVKRPSYLAEQDAHTRQVAAAPQYEARRPPGHDAARVPPGHDPSRVPPGQQRKPSGGGGKHQTTAADGPRGPPPDHGQRPAPSRPAADDDDYEPPPQRRPAYEDEPRRPPPQGDDPRYPEEAGGPRRPGDPPIDVRFGPGASGNAGYDERLPPANLDRPSRQPDRAAAAAVGPPGHQKHGGGAPPGLQKQGGAPPGHQKHGGGGPPGHQGNRPPGLGGDVPPGHGGAVPGHNKGNSNNHNANNHANNNYNLNNNAGWQTSTEPNRWSSTTFKPTPAPQRPQPAPGGEHVCGRTLSVTPLITHGQNTSRGQWPWHAALYQVKGADLKYICGGTLVSANYVVTAAHCVTRPTTGRAVDPDTIIAYLGKYHLHRWTNEEGVQQGKVAAIHVHPEYNTSDFRADVALLELSTPLTFTQYVRHVCMWGYEESTDLNHVVNKEGYVVGWGYDEYGELTEELRMGTMPIVSEQTCLRSYPEFYSRFSNERTFCAGYKNGTSACNGDSGGGLVLPRGVGKAKEWFLRGVVSVSVSRDDHRVCNTEHYVVFTDLAKYRDWMRNYVR